MNKLVIPPSPNWYSTNAMACAPDNTLIYGARNDLVILKAFDKNKPADVHIISKAHSMKVVSVNVNKNWGHPNKLAVTAAEDKIVKVWDICEHKKKLSHNGHLPYDKIIGAAFAGDERVISVSENGVIIVWNLAQNEQNIIKDLFGPNKVTINCFSICPHTNGLTAFGLKNGLVIITDLKKNGKILFKLRGHDKEVTCFAWCPVPINIFPKTPGNIVSNKKSIESNDIENPPGQSPDKNSESKEQNGTGEVGLYQHIVETKQLEVKDEPVVENTPIKNKDHPLLNVYESSEGFIRLKNKVLGINDPQNEEPDSVEIEDTEEESKNMEVCLETTENIEIKDVKSEDGEALTSMELEEKENKKTETSDKYEATTEEEKPEETIKDNKEESRKKPRNRRHNRRRNSKRESREKHEENLQEKSDDAHEESEPKKTNEDIKREIPKTVPKYEEPRKEFLLASSAKNSNIYIWRAGTDGRMQTFLQVSHKPLRGSSYQHKDWTTISWPTPTRLLTANKFADIIEFILPKPLDGTHQKTIQKEHSSLVFNVVNPLKIFNADNFDDDVQTNVWSNSIDRLILNTSVGAEKKTLNHYPTFGSTITRFALSPIDPNKLAIGNAEGILKLWDLSREHTTSIKVTRVYQKIRAKITTLAWHPTNENLLAFGTIEGRLGLLDVSGKARTPELYPQFFKTEVYRAEWGPIDGKIDELGLYVVAEGKLVVHNMKKDPVQIEAPENVFVYAFAWKPDHSRLLLSTKSGILYVYSQDLKIISTNYLNKRLYSIHWHPEATTSDTSISKYCNYLTAVTKAKECVVFTLDNDKLEKICEFTSRGGIINDMSWSLHEANKFVIVTEDGIAEVFDVETKNIVATYLYPHFESLTAVIWSPLEPDLIITGTKDYVLTIWSISENPPKSDEEISKQRKEVLKEISKETTDLVPKSDEVTPAATLKKDKKIKPTLLPKIYTQKEGQYVTDIKKLIQWKSGNVNVENKIGDTNEVDILDLFGAKEHLTKLVDLNRKMLNERGKYQFGNMLQFFKGDVLTAVQDAIEAKRVTPWVISVAPMVSHKLWCDACDVYIDQLTQEANADAFELVTHLLARHRVVDAVRVLCDDGYFPEAFALARLRFSDGHDEVDHVVSRWAEKATSWGNFELAAQCYAYLGKYEEAATVLFRREGVESLEAAVVLAEKTGNDELRKAVVCRYNLFKDYEESEKKTRENGKEEKAALKNGEGSECVDTKNEVITDIKKEEIEVEKNEQLQENESLLDENKQKEEKMENRNEEIEQETDLKVNDIKSTENNQ